MHCCPGIFRMTTQWYDAVYKWFKWQFILSTNINFKCVLGAYVGHGDLIPDTVGSPYMTIHCNTIFDLEWYLLWSYIIPQSHRTCEGTATPQRQKFSKVMMLCILNAFTFVAVVSHDYATLLQQAKNVLECFKHCYGDLFVALLSQCFCLAFTLHLPASQRCHDDVIKWKHFPRYWPFVRGIHWSPVNSLHKGQWRGAFMFSFICAWIIRWVNTREAGDLRRYRAHYDVIIMVVVISLAFTKLSQWLLHIGFELPSLCCGGSCAVLTQCYRA